MNQRRKRSSATSAEDGADKQVVRCAIYCRKSTSEGLDKDFNSIDAQRDSGEAFIRSQQSEGWICLPEKYDDGGFTGANMDRPALQRLIADIDAGKVDCVVVYKVDRLSRSLLDFSRIMEAFDKQGVSFVAVTQSFNTSSSMGRLTLNILLSFGQFEREMISERTRDKMSAARKKGKWAGGPPPLGYDVMNAKLVVNEAEAQQVREMFRLYVELGSLLEVAKALNDRGWTTKRWRTKSDAIRNGYPFSKDNVYSHLRNVTYAGQVKHQNEVYPGEHKRIVDRTTFDKVQELLLEKGRSGATGPRVKGGGLLSGLLRCQSCGCAMPHSYTQRGNRRYRYYVCGRASKRGYGTCPAPSVPAQSVEDFVVNQIREVGKDPAVLAATFAELQIRVAEEVRTQQGQIEWMEDEVRDLYGELSEAALSPQAVDRLAEIQSQIESRQERLTAARAQLQSLENDGIGFDEVARALERFDDVWASLTLRERNDLLKQLLDNVEFDGVAGEITLHFKGAVPRHITEETAA